MRSPRVAPLGRLLILLVGSCATSHRSTPPEHHVGPVTGLADGGAISCSQAGVKTPSGWIEPGFRPIAVDDHEEWVLVGGGTPGEAGNLALFDRTGRVLTNKRFREDLIYGVAIAPDGERALVGCADGSVAWVSLPALDEIEHLTAHTAPCRAVAISHDGIACASAGLDGLVYLYTDGHTAVLNDHTAGVECLAFHGATLYSGARDGKVRRHDDGTLTRTYQRLGSPVQAIAAGAPGIIAGLDDGRLLRLHAERSTHEQLRQTSPIFCLSFHGNNLTIGTVGAAVTTANW